MILSHKYKFIFVHIGKTGGTSIEHTLSNVLSMSMDDTQYNKEIINNVDKIHGYTPAWAMKRDHTGRINCKHITARELRQIVGHRIWDEYYKFSFVRNPYDKLLSEYSMFTQFEAFQNHPWNKYSTFEEFTMSIVTGKQAISENPYHSYLTDTNNVLMVDFVGRFETLQDDFDKICETIGLQKTKLSHISPTIHRLFREHYTPEALEMIYRIRKKDFQLFGYSKKINDMEYLPLIKRVVIMLRYYRHYGLLLKVRRKFRQSIKRLF